MSGINRRSGERSSAVDLGERTTVRYNSHGKRLEMIVNPEEAWLFKQGEDIPIDDVVEGFTIFENLSRGLKANDDDLVDIFGTDNDREVAREMLSKGELQLTQEQRQSFVQEKRDEIIDYLVTHAVNPKTKAPHPKQRIDKAMSDAGVKIERKEPTKDQAERIIKQLAATLPMKIESATIEFVVPPKDTGPLYGFIQGAGEVVNEDWGTDGTLTMLIRVPAGMVSSILEQISDKSKGRVRSTVVDRSG